MVTTSTGLTGSCFIEEHPLKARSKSIKLVCHTLSSFVQYVLQELWLPQRYIVEVVPCHRSLNAIDRSLRFYVLFLHRLNLGDNHLMILKSLFDLFVLVLNDCLELFGIGYRCC